MTNDKDSETLPLSRRKRLAGALPMRSLVPNLLTILALCAGLTAIRFTIQGKIELAASLILIAAILDGLDGRVARYLKGASKIGAELDSLADIVNFGVAPALMLYVWALQDMRSMGWIVVLVFCICMLLRLARFNVMSREDDTPVGDKRFFVGVPAPAGAGLVLLPMFLFLAGFETITEYSSLITAHIAIVSFLVVSRIPTYSFKTILIPYDQIMFILIGAVLFIAIVLTYTWICMVLIDLAYIVSIGLSMKAYRKAKKPA